MRTSYIYCCHWVSMRISYIYFCHWVSMRSTQGLHVSSPPITLTYLTLNLLFPYQRERACTHWNHGCSIAICEMNLSSLGQDLVMESEPRLWLPLCKSLVDREWKHNQLMNSAFSFISLTHRYSACHVLRIENRHTYHS